MTNEQVERAIEFLLENQAKHDARIQELTNKVDTLTTNMEIMRKQHENEHQVLHSAISTTNQMLQTTLEMFNQMIQGHQQLQAIARNHETRITSLENH